MHKALFLTWMLLLAAQLGWAQCDGLPLDNCDQGQVQKRTASAGAMDEISRDPAFDYEQQKPPEETSWLQRFWYWFWQKVGEVIQAFFKALESVFKPLSDFLPMSVTTFVRVVVYVAVAILVVTILYLSLIHI